MRAISFVLSGKTAHFKRPDVNVSTYFTYQHIHKVALLGLLGAILGLKGYNEQGKNDKYPEFYEKLNNIKIAIVPLTKYNGIFSKKIQVFNNSVGYASQEQGNNLIIREQWLENPRWKIFINLESKVETNLLEKLEDYLINSKAIYIPYLGKNDHYANISNVELLELKKLDKPEYVSSLFIWDEISLEKNSFDFKTPFTFKDTMPIRLNEEGMYEFIKLGLTNRLIEETNKIIYSSENENIFFI